ncbi:MAG TPA: SpoIID/LytB domain-containing protein [Candidatus Gracilibacteria bacterium]|nr:SpoIID/LytB domain-containing protein [Candidatus Gracilibacteria bacterium]
MENRLGLKIWDFRKSAAAAILAVFLFITLSVGASTGVAQAANFSGSRFQPKSTFISEIKKSPIPFTGLSVQWHELEPEGTTAALYARFETVEGWGAWQELHGDIDGFDEPDEENPVAYISTDVATAYQYKVMLETVNTSVTPLIENMEFTYIHARDAGSGQGEKSPVMSATISSPSFTTFSALGTTAGASSTVAVKTTPGLKILSRSVWGADESLRQYTEDRPPEQLVKLESDFKEKFSNELKIARRVETDASGKELTWPLEYPEKVSKIIIHHTASTKNLNDPKQAIRDIYYYHTIGRGWGDIGYNYIIDQQGNIYEGRFGGDGVVGAHAGRANVGSIGIAVLGNYQNNDVPEPVIKSLTALIKEKAARYGISPSGSSSFRGAVLPNVMGHRDVMSTSCPGEKLYKQIPAIIALAGDGLKTQVIDKRRPVSGKQAYNFDLGADINIVHLDALDKKTVGIKLKNTGSQTWSADTYIAAGRAGTEGYITNPGDVRSPKINKKIAPGAAATFEMPLSTGTAGGFTTLEVFLMADGKAKVEKYINIPVQVTPANYDYELVALKMSNKYLKRGEKTEALITLKNTGNVSWKAMGTNKILIGTENPRDRLSRILEKPGTRLGGLIEKEVKPGQQGTFRVNMKAPTSEGYYREYFAPVVEGVTWLQARGTYFDFYVADTENAAKYKVTGGMGSFLPGEKKKIFVEFDNTGRSEWKKTGISAFKMDVTPDARLKVTGVALEQDKVVPGQTARIAMTIQAPQTEGTFQLTVMPKIGTKALLARPLPLYVSVSRNKKSDPIVASTATSSNIGKIRIGLSFKGNPVISASSPFKLYDGATALGTFRRDEKVSVTYEQNKFQVRGDKTAFALNTPPRFVPDGGILRIDNYVNRPAWKPELNDNEYRGSLEVHRFENAIVAVNELPLEDYLKGLAEISATEHYEKIKAVIILARSYAKYYTGGARKFPGAPYDLTDDPERSQKYLGYGFEIRNLTGTKAVNDTKGTVVTYAGKVIKTPYFSASTGKTKSAEEVWGWKDTPYLVSVDDPGCKGRTLSGHGVGLSGCGAQYFALQGKTSEEIIKYYFKGVKVEKLQ